MILPALGDVIGFITFIASMISSVSPCLTDWPTAMNGLAPGSGDRKAVPTIGDLTASTGAAAGAASAAGAAGAAAAGAGAAAGAWRIGHDRRGLAADADLAIAVLDLDLGQLVGRQQFGKLAKQRAIDPHRVLSSRSDRPF